MANLLIGNGINRLTPDGMKWENLLQTLAKYFDAELDAEGKSNLHAYEELYWNDPCFIDTLVFR